MSRFAKANMTINDLKKKINSFGEIYDIVYENNKIGEDLSKIDVDFENTDYIGEFDMPGTENLSKFEMLGNFPVAWCACGGDWQMPLVFVLYIGETGKLRAYIPKHGNAYDHKNKRAYEYEDFEEDENEDNNVKYVFNVDELREDVKNRIKIK